MGFFVALKEGITHELGHRLPCQLGAVQCRTKYGFSGFGWADITGHAHVFIDHVRHASLEVYTGKDAFGGRVSHLNGRHNKIGLVFIFVKHHPGTVDYLRGGRTLDDMGFWF
jgi:hypothetical protein